MSIQNFVGTVPSFFPEHFLVGKLKGWGIVESVLGDLQKRFTIDATGTLDTATKTINFTEAWRFDDGFADTLRWQIRILPDGKYSGTENRVEEPAQGERAGCAFHWTYTRNTPQQKDGSSTVLNFDDWFYQIDERVCIVRGSAGRLGLPFAVAHVTYRREDDQVEVQNTGSVPAVAMAVA